MVLVVDDDDDVRDAFCDLIRAKGYSCGAVGNGEEALAFLRTRKPCLILLDLVMPVMDGWQFLSALRSSQELAGVPVVVVSAHAESHAPEGATGLLPKPVEMTTLLRTVAENCGSPN